MQEVEEQGGTTSAMGNEVNATFRVSGLQFGARTSGRASRKEIACKRPRPRGEGGTGASAVVTDVLERRNAEIRG